MAVAEVLREGLAPDAVFADLDALVDDNGAFVGDGVFSVGGEFSEHGAFGEHGVFGEHGALLDLLGADVRGMEPAAGLTVCARVRERFDAIEAELLARVVAADDGDERRAGRMARHHGSSKRETRKRVRRGKAVATNPALGDKLADGSLSGEELDLLANAAAKSDDDGLLFDEALTRRVGAAGPDQGKQIINDWLQQHDSARSVQQRHDRQRHLRNVRRYDTADGLAAIVMEGDDATIDRIWNHVTSTANRMYKADGGRGTPSGSHPRTSSQRLFDAMTHHWCGTENSDRSDRGAGSARGARAGKPTVVVTVTLDKLTGNGPDEAAVQIGTGPIADSVLANYLAHGDLVAMLFNTRGQPLWLGRKRRHASAAQFLALVVRDKGCVLCGANPNQCQAHHWMPWNAPGRGQTNIDELVLLCGTCHRNLHQDKHTIIWNHRDQIWTTRPATPNELPPDRPTGSMGAETVNRRPEPEAALKTRVNLADLESRE